MNRVILAVVAIALCVSQASQSTAQQAVTPAVDSVAPLSDFNLTIEPAVEDVPQKPADATIEEVKPKSGYALARALGEERGKLCVFVGATYCRPCQPAKALFRRLAAELGKSASCVELDVERDAATAGEILTIADTNELPCVVVFTRRDGEWVANYPACNEASLRAKMIGPSNGQASFAAECVGCQSCPADCAASGCSCRASHGAHAGGACGTCGEWYPGKWFAEHKPVRKALKATAVGVALVGKAAAWCLTHPCGGFFRNRCR